MIIHNSLNFLWIGLKRTICMTAFRGIARNFSHNCSLQSCKLSYQLEYFAVKFPAVVWYVTGRNVIQELENLS